MDIIREIPTVLRIVESDFTMEAFGPRLATLPNYKADGPSMMTYEMIKYSSERSIDLLYQIFHDMLATGIILDSWAYNSIVPIYKPRGDRELMEFHRPICLMEIL